MKAFGESHGITELVTPELPAAEEKAHLFAAVSTGIADADCYYRGPYGSGAAFFLVFDTPIRQAPPTSTVQIANILTQVISQLPVNHRTMARAFLRAEGLHVSEEGADLSAKAPDGRSLALRFDEHGRISGIETRAR